MFRAAVANSPTPLRTWTYKGPDVPHPLKEQARLNLWVLGSTPSDGKEIEIVIRGFRFTPLVGRANRQ